MTARDIFAAAAIVPCQPWPRYVFEPTDWATLAAAVPASPFILLALWADTVQVHALLLDEATLSVVPVSTPVTDGEYPALSPTQPHAQAFERMIADLWGHVAAGAAGHRPLFDHGAWPQSKPMALRPEQPRRPYPTPEAGQNDADPVMLMPSGPIWGRIEEAAGFRLTLRGNTIAAAEGQLGFTHKGTLALIRGKAPRTAARFAARLSGDATVAHSIAFATATESALGVSAPPRATVLRSVMLEIERISGHLDNLAEVARLADAPSVQSRCGALRERLRQVSNSAFGHRLMMDCVVPGGVALDIAEGGPQVILRALGDIASDLPGLRATHDGTDVVGAPERCRPCGSGTGNSARGGRGRRARGRAALRCANDDRRHRRVEPPGTGAWSG